MMIQRLSLVATMVWTLGVAAQGAAESPQAIVRYTFGSRQCLAGKFTNLRQPNDASGRLVRDLSQTTCGAGNSPGVGYTANVTAAETNDMVKGIQSQGPVTSILDQVQSASEGITLELWFRTPATVSTALRPILTIGAPQGSIPTSAALNYCDANSIDFQLNQRGHVLELYYRTSEAFLEPCQRYSLVNMTLPDDKLAHVVISLSDSQQQAFVNGQASGILQQSFRNDLAHWNTNNKVQLLAFDNMPWLGRLYELSLYPGTMNAGLVRERLLEGLDASSPYSVNSTVRINEDAEKVAGSHPAEWYSEAQPLGEAVPIRLPVEWLDQEVRDLLESLNLRGPQSPVNVYVYITHLPNKGRLHLPADNRSLDASSSTGSGTDGSVLVLVAVDQVAEIVYLPPRNQYSNATNEVFTTFSYCVAVSSVFSAQQCASSTVDVIVNPVNDPPTALSVEPVTIVEGVETLFSPKILLSGIDEDVDDAITRVQVTKPPTYGTLILTVGSFRQDGLLHGTPLSTLEFTVDSKDADPVFVKYIWNPSSVLVPVVQGDHVQDSFRFRVADRAGLWSTEKTVELKIATALSAVADLDFTIREDSREQTNLHWYGKDTSGYQRRIRYFIESVPSAEVGVLVDVATQQPLTSGTMLEASEIFPYNTGVELSFVSSPDHCNSHKMGKVMSSQVQFRAVAVSGERDSVVSTSDVVTQPIRVDCVIDTLTMTGPSGPFDLKQAGLRRTASDPCRGSIFDPALTDLVACDAAAVVNGIDVEVSDHHVELASVTVLAGKGYLTFNEQSWDLVRPVFGRRAVAANNVTFLANLNDLADILSHLHFQSYHEGRDEIEVMIQYGNCSTIPVNRSTVPFQTGKCQFLRHTIEMVVGKEKAAQVTMQLVMGFPWQILLCMIGYPVLYYALVQSGSTWQAHWGDDETMAVAQDANTDDLDSIAPDWIQHKSDTGDFYYQNTKNGTVTWLAPVGGAYIRWREDEENTVELSRED